MHAGTKLSRGGIRGAVDSSIIFASSYQICCLLSLLPFFFQHQFFTSIFCLLNTCVLHYYFSRCIRFHLPGWIPFCHFLSVFLTCPHFLYLITLSSLVLATPSSFSTACRFNKWSVYRPFLNHMINKLIMPLTTVEGL